jgi:hypothetical protein
MDQKKMIVIFLVLLLLSSISGGVYFWSKEEPAKEEDDDDSGNNNGGNNSNYVPPSTYNDSEEEDEAPEEELEEMEEPSALLNTFKQSGKEFRMGVYEGGQLKCVRIDTGKNDKFVNKDNVHAQTCRTSDKAQYWKYNDVSNQIQTVRQDAHGRTLCLDWNNDKFKVTNCEDTPPENRQFTFTAPDSEDVDDVAGKPRWGSSDTVSNAIPVRIRPESDDNANCIANAAGSTKNTRVASCVSTGTRYYIMTD